MKGREARVNELPGCVAVGGLASDGEAFQPVVGCVKVSFSPVVPYPGRKALRLVRLPGFDLGHSAHHLSGWVGKLVGHHGLDPVQFTNPIWIEPSVLAHRVGNLGRDGHHPYHRRYSVNFSRASSSQWGASASASVPACAVCQPRAAAGPLAARPARRRTRFWEPLECRFSRFSLYTRYGKTLLSGERRGRTEILGGIVRGL